MEQTPDTTIKKQPERKSKRFWAADDFWNVVEVTGYECPPDNDTWWVPGLGYSLSEKHHLFATAAEARAMAIKKLESAISDLQSALTRLQAESRAALSLVDHPATEEGQTMTCERCKTRDAIKNETFCLPCRQELDQQRRDQRRSANEGQS